MSSIDPRIITSPGDPAGITRKLVDLERLMKRLAWQVGSQAPNSIVSSDIAAGAIVAGHIAAGAVTAGSIEAGAITASHLAANSVTANAIAANSIQATHIAAGQVTATHLAAGSVTAAAIQAGTITSTQIAAGTITAQNIASGTITATQIASGTITATQIASDTITASQIAADAITAVELAAGSVDANAIQANAVTANAISANSVYTAALQAGAVTSDKITVSTLSALSTNMGSITAGTITGAVIQTATSGSRVVMNSSGLTGYALNGTTKVFEINVGTGIASFTGIANIDPLSVIPGGTITTNTLPGDRIVTASIQSLQIAAGAIVANTIAAGAITAQKIGFVMGGSNLLRNSSFENTAAPLDQWGVSGAVASHAVSTTEANPDGRGSRSYSLVPNSATVAALVGQGPIPCKEDTWYTFSYYIKASSATGARTVQSMIGNVNAGNNIFPGAVLSTGTTWKRYVGTFKTPIGCTSVVPYVHMDPGANLTNTYYIDDAQLELGEIATAYGRTVGEILPGEVGTTQITDDSITTNKILAGTIQGNDIAASTITGTNIAAATITADRLSVTTLSAITADMGSLTAGTITGGIVRSSSSSTRVQMDSTGVYALQAGVQTFRLDATSGIVTQGKRSSLSNQVHWSAFVGAGPSVTINVDANVSLVHIYAEVEVSGDLGNVLVGLREPTDIPNLGILEGGEGLGGGATWQVLRTIAGSSFGTTSKLAGYISYRPSLGTRTYSLELSAPTDAGNATNAYVRNRMIHVFTT